MSDTDIVRELHGAADCAGLVCTKTGNFRAAMIDAAHLRAAAAEIERLRKQLDVVSMSIRFANAEIKQLRAERDEARREICERVSITRWQPQFPLMTKGQYAEERGWDCFKEEP